MAGYKLHERISNCEHLVYNANAFATAHLGHYVKEHTTKDIYVIGDSADDREELSFLINEGAVKQLVPAQDLDVQPSWADDLIAEMDA